MEYQLDAKGRSSVVYYQPSNDKPARIYIRCSLDKQVNDGFTIPTQYNDTTNYCVKNNYSIQGIYYDLGISGNTNIDKRLGLKQLLADVKPLETVMVVAQDRISRNNTLSSQIADYFIQNKIALLSTIESQYLIGNDRVLYNLKATIAERECQLASIRTTAVMKYLKDNNKLIKKPKFGWKRPPQTDEESKSVEPIPDPQEQAVIEHIKLLRTTNPNIRISEIIKSLTVQFPPSGFKIKAWHHNHIQNIINDNNLPGHKPVKTKSKPVAIPYLDNFPKLT